MKTYLYRAVHKPAVQNNTTIADTGSTNLATFHSDQILTTNFLVLFMYINEVLNTLRLCSNDGWIGLLFYFTTV